MRPGQQQQQNKRMRGRGRKGPNPMSRSYESNGPDVKIRGNAQHIAEKYTALARDASASGDRVMAENYLQHAEHYGRIVAAAQGTFQLQRDDVDMDGDYEEGDEEGATEGFGPTNGHPYPVPERAQGERPQQQPNQGRESREFQNRDYQGNREQHNNRDQQGNREGREQRFDRNRNRDRDFNRDNQGQGQGRDRNRDNRPEGEGRRSWEGRDRQNWQDRQVPNGLGPQPTLAEAGSSETAPNSHRPDEAAPRQEERFVEPARGEEITAAPVVTEQESGFGQAVATQDAVAEPEGSIYGGEAAPEAREPRRRGRPRRPRYGEGDTSYGCDVAPVEAAAPAPEAEAPMPVASAEAVSAVDSSAEGEAAPAKRRPGRPRKKKVEDDQGEGDVGHLPDFLLASNG